MVFLGAQLFGIMFEEERRHVLFIFPSYAFLVMLESRISFLRLSAGNKKVHDSLHGSPLG